METVADVIVPFNPEVSDRASRIARHNNRLHGGRPHHTSCACVKCDQNPKVYKCGAECLARDGICATTSSHEVEHRDEENISLKVREGGESCSVVDHPVCDVTDRCT